MKMLKTASTAVLLLSSLSAFATTISFESGTDDVCTDASGDCTTQSIDWSTYVDPASDATWIQSADTNDIYADYTISELDLSSLTTDSVLTSLYVTFDDTLSISIDGVTIFDSVAEGITYGWTTVTDVFDYIDETYISAGSTIYFTVTNTGLPSQVYGPDGVSWSGTVEVPEPSMVFALGLGLVAFGFKRRQNKNL